ncbi:GDSL family lipase [Rudanella paleaurantiibacter]|uniref:GDSL family lipase n=1 Tax=Rudanella paleaurantiibacter TaxID=2614655 RepID=A0A7J5TUK0_9BACT|nr:GDSL family lipase [Rudanella paleaurantiibacter]
MVFVGNSLFENDVQYGYLELALTTRWPDKEVTFRNIGWTGDNVYGVARSTITNPPTAYELLMEHLTKAQPTVVFIGYGNIEAQEGEAGLPRFVEGLNKLVDKVDQLGAQAVLLSTIPVLSDSIPNRAEYNAMLQRYAGAIAKIATDRGKRYVDLFGPLAAIPDKRTITENGIHLNEAGYYRLATLLEDRLGLPARNEAIQVTVGKASVDASGPVRAATADPKAERIQFTVDERLLPLPKPTDPQAVPEKGNVLTVKGLRKGYYTLHIDKAEVVTASANDWANGVEIRQGSSVEQARDLRHLINKKNELFYFQYRPLNTTYILGFRSYEQGRHVKGLEEQNFIIRWLESQISLTRTPKPRVYQLTLLK